MISNLVFANGDPVIHYSSILKAGNPIPRKITDIQIVKENLYIQPDGIYTHVKVEYVLYNKSDKDYTDIDYGFPIDYTGTTKWGFEGDYYSESLYEIGWSEQNIKNVAFFLDGKYLPNSSSDTIVDAPRMEYNEEIDSTVLTTGISRKWYYTHLQIKSKKSSKLTVTYSLYNSRSTALYLFGGSILNKYFPGRIQFNYDFSPAQHWGDGTIDDFTVKVDLNMLKSYQDGFKNSITGLLFVRNGNVLTFHSNNFQLKKSKPLQISFSHQGQLPSLYELANQRIDNDKFSVKACGENRAYPVSNLTDMNLETAWVSDKDIVGDSIVITMKKPIYVTDILLYNGYQKSEILWMQNGMLSEIKVDVTWADKELNSYKIISNISLEPAKQKYEWTELGIDQFKHPMIINLTQIYLLPPFWTESNRFDSRIKKIKITFLRTVAGKKYKDICVSELILLGM